MTTTVQTVSSSPPLTPLQWTICAIAALGFAFDSYELLMLPLIVRPALADLLGVAPNSLAVNDWVGTLQYVPAVAGGIFGLLGGYLTDLFGRRRVLVWSILLYAFSAFAANSRATWMMRSRGTPVTRSAHAGVNGASSSKLCATCSPPKPRSRP